MKRLHGIATADYLVQRKFHRLSPNELWITDISPLGASSGVAPAEHLTREGKIYCCAVIDPFSKTDSWLVGRQPVKTLPWL